MKPLKQIITLACLLCICQNAFSITKIFNSKGAYYASNSFTFLSDSTTPNVLINNPPSVCFPATVNLTSSSITAGSTAGLTFTYWTDASATILYSTPSSAVAGIYYIKGMDVNGFFDIKQVTVIVNPIITPSVSIASNSGNSICAGTNVTFTATCVNGGTPSYQWRKGSNNIIGATSASYSTSSLTNGSAISVVITAHDNCASPTTAISNTITMVVIPTVTPTITISIAQNNVCNGITYSSVITNGGISPGYQWALNGTDIAGATNYMYTASGILSGNNITCKLTSNAACATPITVTSNSLTVNLTIPTTTWLGLSSNFSTSSNWSNGVPNNNLSVIINSNTPYSPAINGIASVYSLTINAGASLTISAANLLTIYGNFINNGNFIPNNGEVQFASCNGTGAIPHIISSSNNTTTTFNNFTLNDIAGVTLNCNAALTGCLKLINGTFTNNNKTFTFKSTVSATAYLAPVPASAAIVGKITMQRLASGPKTGWTQLGTPVSGATLAQWKDNFATSGFLGSNAPISTFKSIYTYNETMQGAFDTISSYIPASNITDPLKVGVGYLVYLGTGSVFTNDILIDVNGTPTVGDFNFKPDFTNTGNVANDGFNLIANPYPSAIDWLSPAWSKSNINDAIYMYQADNGQYASFVNGVSTNGGSQYIASSQGFYIQANNSNPTLIANENIKSNTNPELIRQSGNATTDRLIKLKLSNNDFSDETVIRLNANATTDFDKGFDACKMYSPDTTKPAISSIINKTDFSINTIAGLDKTIAIPIKVKVGMSGEYTITFDGVSSFPKNQCIVFEDLLTHAFTDVTKTKFYTFTISDTTSAPRFIIHIASPLPTIVTDVNCGNTSDGTITIQEGNSKWSYELRTKENEFIAKGNLKSTPHLISTLSAGDYILHFENEMGCTNMDTILTIGYKASPSMFEQNTTLFITQGEASITLSDTSASANSYIWDFGDGTVIGTVVPTASHAYKTNGTYIVSMTAQKNDCKSVKSLTLNIFENPDKKTLMDIQVVNDEYYAVFKFNQLTQVTIRILNASGQIVTPPQVIQGITGSQKIDMSNSAAGIYIINLTCGETTFTKKIIKTDSR